MLFFQLDRGRLCWWVKHLTLTQDDEVMLQSGDQLTDKHINAAQKLIKEQFNHIQGLQDTLLSQKREQINAVEQSAGFLPEGNYNNVYIISFNCVCLLYIIYCLLVAIQIMYVEERGHWICTSYLNGVVRVYDSLFNGKLSPSVKEMLIRLYRPAVTSGHLVVTVTPTQQQQGKTDCGLFAIGCAYHVAAGLVPFNLEQASVRAHLHKCFQQEILTPFPKKQLE